MKTGVPVSYPSSPEPDPKNIFAKKFNKRRGVLVHHIEHAE
jgi:hypothetical protein